MLLRQTICVIKRHRTFVVLLLCLKACSAIQILLRVDNDYVINIKVNILDCQVDWQRSGVIFLSQITHLQRENGDFFHTELHDISPDFNILSGGCYKWR